MCLAIRKPISYECGISGILTNILGISVKKLLPKFEKFLVRVTLLKVRASAPFTLKLKPLKPKKSPQKSLKVNPIARFKIASSSLLATPKETAFSQKPKQTRHKGILGSGILRT